LTVQGFLLAVYPLYMGSKANGKGKALSYYGLLQVSPRASTSVIKAAYRALAQEHHPDHGGTTEVFTKLTDAFEVLSDPDKRAEYDKNGDAGVGTVIGNYKVLELIAEGGFGSTYKGEQLITGSPVCIKHCSQVSAAHDAVLIGEAKAIWDLRHHALPAMRDMHRLDDGSLALIMSYVPGPTLEQVVEKVGKLDGETTAWITERILNALLYLHHHGVVHGDIKPQNVIIQPDIHAVVLVDFGLAVVKPTSKSKAQGYTPFFAPPEQIAGRTLLPASDFYSLGMLMIYALSGNMKAVERVQVPTDVPDIMCKFMKGLIAHDILARPQGDLFDQFRDVRHKAFGRTSTGMKPIPGL
jgi:predicted Ser/Thr protein kinase